MKLFAAIAILALLSQVVIGCSHTESKCSTEDDRTIIRCVNDEWVETKCGKETVCREQDHTGPFCDHDDDHEDWDVDHDWEGHHEDHNEDHEDWDDHSDDHEDWDHDDHWDNGHDEDHQGHEEDSH